VTRRPKKPLDPDRLRECAAAAKTASAEQPESLPFLTLGDRLAAAARREGLPVLP